MNVKITVRTRSSNEDLYNKMSSLIPDDVVKIRHDDYREWQDAARFLHDVIEQTEGMLLIVDDDCFIPSWGNAVRLIEHCYANNVVYCGVPDFEIIPHRTNSWAVFNPFFLLVNCDIVNAEKAKHTREYLDSYKLQLPHEAPSWVTLDCTHGDSEIFNGLFYWLYDTFPKKVYLASEQMDDGISTKLSFFDLPLCYHSWYSREYSHDAGQKERIDNLFEYAYLKSEVCKFAIIVPYRDRESHLDLFIKHYSELFPATEIVIVEQSGDAPFNRAMLLNIGFLERGAAYGFCAYHDVDMLTKDASKYRYPYSPTCIATRCSQFNYEMPYKTYFGGVTLISRKDMERLNGFSNMFKGWGGEDDEMYAHIIKSGLTPAWRDCVFESLPHQRVIDKNLHKKNALLAKVGRLKLDGLSNCKYSVLNVSVGEFTKITVDISSAR